MNTRPLEIPVQAANKLDTVSFRANDLRYKHFKTR